MLNILGLKYFPTTKTRKLDGSLTQMALWQSSKLYKSFFNLRRKKCDLYCVGGETGKNWWQWWTQWTLWHCHILSMTLWQLWHDIMTVLCNKLYNRFFFFVICWKKIFLNISENQYFSIFPLNWANNFYLNCKLIVAEQSWHFRRAPVQTCSYFSLEWILFSRLSLSTFSLWSCDTFYWIFQ